MQTDPALVARGPGKFIHCVFFTLKPGTPDTEIDSLIGDAQALLAKIPSVRRIDSGRRDPRFNRDVNDKDYTVGLLVCFDDKDGHDIYADHPLHLEFLSRHKAHWASVRVFDFGSA